MAATDLKKRFSALYSPSAREVSIVDVPLMSFLMVDGEGDPNTAVSYQDAIQALYSVSYTLKFMLKQGPEAVDYIVMPLEGLWWTEGGGMQDVASKDGWRWTAMIMQPDAITAEHVRRAIERAQTKRDLPALPRLRFASFEEGRAAQVMHIGPYAAEAPAIERLHAFIEAHGGRLTGKHHEIYLSDPGRTAPERLKTIIRQPFVPGQLPNPAGV